MRNEDWIIFKRRIGYEWDYFSRKFKLSQKLLVLIALACIVITGLGDTQGFFSGENSPIPETWKLFKDRNISLFLSILILLLGYFSTVFRENKQSEKDNNDVLAIVREYVIPGINEKLENLREDIQQQFSPNGNIRLSLWIPVRKGFLKWNLEMVCKTPNIPDIELEASFRLNEGVIGYTYLRNKRRYCIEFIDLSNREQLPESYTELQGDNKILIDSKIKGVLAVAVFVKSSIVGLLGIDTDNADDLSIIENNELHRLALGWIRQYTSSVGLVWRMKNNV